MAHSGGMCDLIVPKAAPQATVSVSAEKTGTTWKQSKTRLRLDRDSIVIGFGRRFGRASIETFKRLWKRSSTMIRKSIDRDIRAAVEEKIHLHRDLQSNECCKAKRCAQRGGGRDELHDSRLCAGCVRKTYAPECSICTRTLEGSPA